MTYREEQLILKRIEELEKHQKEQDRKLEMLHDRVFPESYENCIISRFI